MAQQYPTTQETSVEAGEVHDRGILDFSKKEEENKPKGEMSVPEFADVHVPKTEEKREEEEHNPSAATIEKLTSSNSSRSSSDEGESEEGNKKKGIQDKIKERITGNKEEHEKDNEVAPVDGEVETEEKKGFMEKMKEKLTGGGTDKSTEKETIPVELEGKVLVEKIKGKLPGTRQNGEETEKVEEVKEQVKEWSLTVDGTNDVLIISTGTPEHYGLVEELGNISLTF